MKKEIQQIRTHLGPSWLQTYSIQRQDQELVKSGVQLSSGSAPQVTETKDKPELRGAALETTIPVSQLDNEEKNAALEAESRGSGISGASLDMGVVTSQDEKLDFREPQSNQNNLENTEEKAGKDVVGVVVNLTDEKTAEVRERPTEVVSPEAIFTWQGQDSDIEEDYGWYILMQIKV